MGARSRFVGELSGEDEVVVAGRVEGTVRASERVTVAAAGQVAGDIHARTVLVHGRVHGQIFASEKAELSATAAVEGSVEAPKIVISEGAKLEGTVAMASRGDRGGRKSEG